MAQTPSATPQGDTKKKKHSEDEDGKLLTPQEVDALSPQEEFARTGLTLVAALHMSATILPATRVSKMLVVAKLNTFSRATC